MEMIYESIEELPIWNWNKVHEKSDFTYLRVNRINSKVSKKEYLKLKRTWDKLFSEYIDMFGFSEHFLRLHAKRTEIAMLKTQKIMSGDLSLNTFIEIAQKELVRMQTSQTKGGDFWQSKVALEEVLGFRINVKETSVVEFYSYVKSIKEKKPNGR